MKKARQIADYTKARRQAIRVARRLRVKRRNTRGEQMFSALPPKADMTLRTRHVRFVPEGDILAWHDTNEAAKEVPNFFTMRCGLNFRARATAVHDRFASPFSLRMRLPLFG
jgi:hypothetical protein